MLVSMSGLVDVALAAGSLAVAAASLLFTYGANRRSQYDRVLAEVTKLTTGETARDRHRAAWAGEPGGPHDNPHAEATYNVLWAFDRLEGLYNSLAGPFGSSRINRPRKLLLDTARSSIEVWNDLVRGDLKDARGALIPRQAMITRSVKRLHQQLVVRVANDPMLENI